MAEKKPAKKDKKTDVANYDYGAHADKGFENQTQADVSIPFLAVLQKGSPQLDTIIAAEAGKLFNTVTEEVLDEAQIVPVSTHHVYVEWIKRTEGGGFVAVHAVDSEVVAKARAASTERKLPMENGHELVETFYVYAVLCKGKVPVGPVVLAFTSMKIKVYKKANTRWNTFMLMDEAGTKTRPPMFSHLTNVGTVFVPYNKGDFHNFTLEPASGDVKTSLLAPTDPRFQMGAELHELISSGSFRIAYESVTQEGDDGNVDDHFK